MMMLSVVKTLKALSGARVNRAEVAKPALCDRLVKRYEEVRLGEGDRFDCAAGKKLADAAKVNGRQPRKGTVAQVAAWRSSRVRASESDTSKGKVHRPDGGVLFRVSVHPAHFTCHRLARTGCAIRLPKPSARPFSGRQPSVVLLK